MAEIRGYEIPTIDCKLITISAPSLGDDELTLDTATQIQVTPGIETTDAIRLIIKGVLRSQKPQQNTVTGNTIVLTDNVFNPELVQILQGGTLVRDTDTGELISYTPPVAGSSQDDQGEVFTLNCYTTIYSPSAIIKGYEKISYPNCQGVPVALSAEDDVFRVAEYTINSAPDMGQPPYVITWIRPEELPNQPTTPPDPFPDPTPPEPVPDDQLTGLTISGLTLIPDFDPETLSYTATTDTRLHTVTATPSDSGAVVEIRLNDTVVSGGIINLDEGNNTLTIEVVPPTNEG